MQVDLLVQNAVVVNSKTCREADILVRDGKVLALARPFSGCSAVKTIDARGAYVMPGTVDAHTHMMDPGYTDREEFVTGTMAAAVGGVTTVVDHHRTVPAVYSVGPLREKIAYLADKACVDFGLKGGITLDNLNELEAMWQEGITGFKTFTCNLHGVKAMHTGFLQDSFREVARLDGTVLLHCEDDGICQHNEDRLRAQGRTDYMAHWECRSKLAERVAVKTVIEIAKETGCRIAVAHISQPELLQALYEAREQGYETYAETCPHYLYLTTDDLKAKGPWVKFTPPMNTADQLPELWKLFNRGYVTTIGSDHCPYPKEQKLAGETSIWDAPNGIPGVETSLRLMLNAVNEGKTNLNRVVQCMCENPARLYGLYPRKGLLEPGADADLVLLDMEQEQVLRNEDIVSKCKWTPYDGMKIKGVPKLVTVRGKIVAENGKFVGKPGHGEFVKRQFL